jgi:peptidoglycan/LPS O-acetylase OafA/YrhL
MHRGRVPQLDAIRGLAVLAVLFFHAGLLPVGWLGVPVFFVLSGYLVTRQLRDGMPALTFWVRRLRRVAPLLYAYLAVNLAIALCLGYDTTGYGWHFAFLTDQAIARGAAGQHGHIWHLWSIAVEMQAYALAPFVARRRGLLALIAITGIAYWLLAGFPMTLAGSAGFFAIGGLLSDAEAPRWTAPAWLTAIGRAGYSIYLWQMVCIAAATRLGMPLLGLPLSLAVGFMSYRVIECHAATWTLPVMVERPLLLSRPATERIR